MSEKERTLGPVEATRILTDVYSARILSATSRRPKSPQDISEECGIPIAACYRRIKKLTSVGFLECAGRPLTQEGKRVRVYKCKIFNAKIFFKDGKFLAKFLYEDGRRSDFGGEWRGEVE